MFDEFSSLPVRNKELPAGSLQTLIQVYEREMFTGVLHLRNPAGAQAALFFVQGGLVLFYALSQARWAELPANEWRPQLAHLDGDLRVLALPVEGLRTFRLFLDRAGGGAPPAEALPATVVLERLTDWQKGAEPCLIQLRRSEITVYLAFPGNLSNSSEALLLSPERFQTGLGVLAQVRSWGERPCELARAATDLGSTAGREYSLRISFLSLTHRILERYQELAGRFLGSALNEEINHMNRERGWSMYFAGAGITHREFFMDAARAGEAYQVVLTKLENEMELVVGSQVADQIIQSALGELPPSGRELLVHALPGTHLTLDHLAQAA